MALRERILAAKNAGRTVDVLRFDASAKSESESESR
jgi:hypothetical protein